MKVLNSAVIVALLFAVSCASTKKPDARDTSLKIEFDLTRLDRDGLRGPPDGKVAVAPAKMLGEFLGVASRSLFVGEAE